MLLSLFFSFGCFAQLPSFTLTVTPTPQTCLGNGALSFAVTGNDPAASMDYAVYLHPNTTTPLTVVTTSSLGSLVAGTYTVIATQSLGGNSNTSTATVTIANNYQPVVYNIVTTKATCGNTGAVSINITAGSAVSYAITSGPVTRPVQPSNTFGSLPVGQYDMSITDSCGTVQVVTFQIAAVVPGIIVDEVFYEQLVLPTCNTITISHEFISSGADNAILFPLTFEYTVYPPGGGTPTIVTQVVATGVAIPGVNQIDSTIPFYNNQQYSYNLKITDACGYIFTRNNNIVNQKFDITLLPNNPGCAEFNLGVAPMFYRPPYTITFNTAPAGFNPSDFNPLHPVFSTAGATYGSTTNPIPEGAYSITVTDACGRTATKDITISNDSPPSYDTSSSPVSCLGQVLIALSGRPMTIVEVTAAPAAYPHTLPHDVSANIQPSGFALGDLPFGDYVFQVTDACGVAFDVEVELAPVDAAFDLEKVQRPGCAIGEGSLRLRIVGGMLGTVTITAAPAAFNETLPFNASSFLNEGVFYMNTLSEGTYTFLVTNACGVEKTETLIVEGYHIQTNTVDIIPNCSSFDINLNHTSNGSYVQSFWLQKYDAVTGNWGHPQTGTPYTPGTLPTNANSIYLNNNAMNYTFAFLGQFRIIKAFHVFSNGSSSNTRCFTIVDEFTFESQLTINGAYGFPCSNNLSEVAIDAVGVAPLQYAIVDENDNVLVDNGTSNVFTSLPVGTYIFRVTDACGNSGTIPVDVNELPAIQVTGSGLCQGENGQLSVTQFSFLNYEWWKEGAPEVILSTSSVLQFSPFDATTDGGTYYVRITSDVASSCMEDTVLSYVVSPDVANAGEDNSLTYCNDGEEIDLSDYLSTPHDTDGIWTDTDGSGALNGSVLTTAGLVADTYHFNYTVTDDCNNDDEAVITVEIKDRPSAPVVFPVDPVCEGVIIELTADFVADASYQWTGPDNFSSSVQNPVIANATTAAAGTYQLIVTVNDCASPAATVAVTVNALPDFVIEGNTSLCEGQSTELSVTASNFDEDLASYQWYHDSIMLDGITASAIEVFEIGEYKVVVNNNGCISEHTVNVVENTNAFVVELESGCKDFDYVISVLNTADFPDAVYFWNGPGGFTAATPEIVITGAAQGEYKVTVTNADGCTAEASTVVLNTNCMIPRGISPGDADFNNNWDLSNMQVEHLSIFNRYGVGVYEKDNYKDEWYGQSKNGHDLPTGTYYYSITLSSGKRLTGWVYLQREVK